ncbi:transcription elongation factor GreA [Patescibacteria group bacterium]
MMARTSYQNLNTHTNITLEGYNRLTSELDLLKNQKRPQAVKRLAIARSLGDLSENNEYVQAREALAMLDTRIDELEMIMARAKVAEKVESGSGVTIGSRVTVTLDDEEIVFHLVGEWEADPSSQKISHESPLGKKLLGRKPGEEIEVEAPVGKLVYRVIRIES